MAKPLLALTMGDPGGVGPEIALKMVARADELPARLLIVGDGEYLGAVAEALDLAPPPPGVSSGAEAREGDLPAALLQVGALGGELRFGQVAPDLGAASLAYIDAAVDLAAAGDVDGIVTGPVSKAAISVMTPGFSGHTEYLASRLDAGRVVMMLDGGGLKVGLVTTHASIRGAIESLTVEAIREAGLILDLDLRRRFGVDAPRIGVAGVNPHASEGALFGDEERRVIAPAVERLRAAGIRATGPEVPDVVFVRMLRGEFDAVLAMYHDQACIPVKTLAFDTGVNVTLGLPVVRTSPDHGTATQIAGKGTASEASLAAAIDTAALMCRNGPSGSAGA